MKTSVDVFKITTITSAVEAVKRLANGQKHVIEALQTVLWTQWCTDQDPEASEKDSDDVPDDLKMKEKWNKFCIRSTSKRNMQGRWISMSS